MNVKNVNYFKYSSRKILPKKVTVVPDNLL